MKENMRMYGDTFTEFNVMVFNLREMNIRLVKDYRQQSIYDLFIYLVNKGYKKEASELWDKMISFNFFGTH
jgi:hypothetical protein